MCRHKEVGGWRRGEGGEASREGVAVYGERRSLITSLKWRGVGCLSLRRSVVLVWWWQWLWPGRGTAPDSVEGGGGRQAAVGSWVGGKRPRGRGGIDPAHRRERGWSQQGAGCRGLPPCSTRHRVFHYAPGHTCGTHEPTNALTRTHAAHEYAHARTPQLSPAARTTRRRVRAPCLTAWSRA